MRRQVLYGAMMVLASGALVACEPYGYGPYGYGAYGPYRYGYGAYGAYGGYPPPPPVAYGAPPPTPAVPQPPPAAPQMVPVLPPGAVAAVPAPCRKGVLWPFVREPGDCPTDAERFANYPYGDYLLLGPQ